MDCDFFIIVKLIFMKKVKRSWNINICGCYKYLVLYEIEMK